MNRVLSFLVISLAVLVGCQVPAEREALRPLPDKGLPLTYPELFNRARLQAAAAVEAFYADNWLELEQTSQVLAQTASRLPKAPEPPANLKKSLEKESEILREQAAKLTEAARTKNVQTISDTLQRIQTSIRTLRPPE